MEPHVLLARAMWAEVRNLSSAYPPFDESPLHVRGTYLRWAKNAIAMYGEHKEAFLLHLQMVAATPGSTREVEVCCKTAVNFLVGT